MSLQIRVPETVGAWLAVPKTQRKNLKQNTPCPKPNEKIQNKMRHLQPKPETAHDVSLRL